MSIASAARSASPTAAADLLRVAAGPGQEGQRTHRVAAYDERDHHSRHEPEGFEIAEMALVSRDYVQVLRYVCVQLGPSGSKHPAHRALLDVRISWVTPLQIADELLEHGVDVRHCDLVDLTPLDDVDDAAVRKRGYGESSQAFQRGLVVQRGREERACSSEELEALAGPLRLAARLLLRLQQANALCDLDHDGTEAQRTAVRARHGVDARQPRPLLARLCGRLPPTSRSTAGSPEVKTS